jgi:hypothetical protein
METIMDEKKAKPKKGTVGGGRAPGQKNLTVGETKREIKAFFQELTIDSMRWRQDVKRYLETAHDAREFRFWSTIALSYGFGTPTKMQSEGGAQRSLIFAMTHGFQPWAPEVDPLRERAAAMIAAKAEREQLLALEGGNETVIEAKAAPEDDAAAETLESVNPDDPRAFGGR